MKTLLNELASRGSFPGAVWRVEGPTGPVTRGTVGHRALVPEPLEARDDVLYDLASVTKAACTAVLAVLADHRGELPLDRPVGEVLPVLQGTPLGDATLEQCLLHTSGLPAWRPLYCMAASRDEVPGLLATISLENKDQGPVYSDLGPIVAGFVLEQLYGCSLGRLFQDRVAGPLDLEDLEFLPGTDKLDRIAPTETGNATERRLARETPGDPCGDRTWDERMIHGRPHDGNARFLDGVSGHAGLFGTAADLARLGREILSPSGAVLEPGMTERLLEPRAGSPSHRRCLLGESASGTDSPGNPISPRAAGHVGFTGTSWFLDPDTGGVFVLLTNRVHPVERRDVPMQAIRRQFHQKAMGILENAAG